MPEMIVAPAIENVELTELVPVLGAGVSMHHTEESAGRHLVAACECVDSLQTHPRLTRRRPIEVACDVNVVVDGGTIFDSGTALVRNISPSGALIGDFRLKGNCLPLQPFRLVLRLKDGDYAGICIEATPLRFAPEVHGLGVRFDEVCVSL